MSLVYKKMKNKVVTRVYNRETTLFAKWKIDNKKSLQQLVAEDLKYWKASKFIKTDDDVSKF